MSTTKYYDSLGNELFPVEINNINTSLVIDAAETRFCRVKLAFKTGEIARKLYRKIAENCMPIRTITIMRKAPESQSYTIEFNNYPVALYNDTIITNTFKMYIKHDPINYYITGVGEATNSFNDKTKIINFTWQGAAVDVVDYLVFRQVGVICFNTANEYLGIVYFTIGYNILNTGETSNFGIVGDGYSIDSFGGMKAAWDNISILPLDYANKDLDNTGNTTIGGGYGKGNNPHDTIDVPQLPNLVISNTGSSLYALTSAEMQAFSGWLWTSDWTKNIKKLRTDPMQNIIGVSIVDIPLTGDASTIFVGNLNSGVNANLISNWVSVDCGSINVEEYYGTFADYEPYIAITLYLPKVGFVQIPADAVVNNSIKIVYNIELTSGEGLCYIYIVNNRDNFSYVYNTYTCHVSANVALSASDHTQQLSAIINASINTTAAIGGAIATGGATTGSAATTVASSALNVATTKNPTQTRGNFGNFGTLMCVKKPYLIINRTNLTKPSSFQENNGYMINYTAKIDGHTGFLKTRDYHCEFNAPYNHRAEIEKLMDGGIIINA